MDRGEELIEGDGEDSFFPVSRSAAALGPPGVASRLLEPFEDSSVLVSVLLMSKSVEVDMAAN